VDHVVAKIFLLVFQFFLDPNDSFFFWYIVSFIENEILKEIHNENIEKRLKNFGYPGHDTQHYPKEVKTHVQFGV
jgi:hypothetical protein